MALHTGTALKGGPPTPIWPELDAAQKADALAASWPARLRFAMAGAALLAFLTAAASFRAADGMFDWRVGVSLTLGGSFLASFFLIKSHGFSRVWLAPLGLITITLTLVNLMACMMEQVKAGLAHSEAAVDPALVFLTLIVGSLWALRIHLSPTGFTLAAIITGVVLWGPWVMLSSAPFEFALIGLACIAAGAQMRWIGAERAYAAYCREVVWPRLWRGSVQAAVLREISQRANEPPKAEPANNSVMDQLASAVDVARVQTSLVGLASALGSSEAPATSSGQNENKPDKVDSSD